MELEPAQIDRERADAAFNLRVAGLSWAQVARETGYANRQNAQRAVKSRCGSLPQPERRELRDLWRDRLERLWLQSVRDVAEQRNGAITAAVRVVQAAAILDGLNAPVQIDARIDATISDTFMTLVQELSTNDL
jgi:hypothetical protein